MTLSKPMGGDGRTLAQRAFDAIAGKTDEDQMRLLNEYVEQGVRDQEDGLLVSGDDLNELRRRYIRIASEVYRGRYVR